MVAHAKIYSKSARIEPPGTYKRRRWRWYQKATKKNKEKHVLLNKRIKMIGYDRCYLVRLSRSRAKKLRFGGKIVIVGDLRKGGRRRPQAGSPGVQTAR